MIITLPHVNKRLEWKPITISVIKNAITTTGMYLRPKKEKKKKLNAIKLVKLGGCGINLLADNAIKTQIMILKFCIF